MSGLAFANLPLKTLPKFQILKALDLGFRVEGLGLRV